MRCKQPTITTITAMKRLNLTPHEYTQGREAANAYDLQQIIALRAERQRVLDNKRFLGRAATRLAAQFYRGELGTNTWQINRHRSALRARQNSLED